MIIIHKFWLMDTMQSMVTTVATLEISKEIFKKKKNVLWDLLCIIDRALTNTLFFFAMTCTLMYNLLF